MNLITLKPSHHLRVAPIPALLAITCTATWHRQQCQQMRRETLAVHDHYQKFPPCNRAPHIYRHDLVFSQGEIFKSESPSDLAVNGFGCFGVRRGGVTRYTRDGRFFFRDGVLTNSDGWNVLGYTDSQVPGGLKLTMDPCSKLYEARYTSFHFDETGRCFGESTMMDPVTGEVATTLEPLFQVALYSLHKPFSDEPNGLLQAEAATPSRAGEGAMGAICPGSLERSNQWAGLPPFPGSPERGPTQDSPKS